ncbi:ral GTPase-activating protein subunit beta isoform X8 [Hermetia illucens]|uniref:ral GTPase-activating protein subunit beta isoform X8 n=1 Tax=Hermetia illucens TaxID=343691 RepID=UPI0018CBFE4F|nr:ral GTPase-activating protein subunit beta isoform X8 [Hermetia illucens]
MYSEWVSLSQTIASNSCGAQSQSVLNKFPASAGREVAVSVVKQLATNLGITQNAEPSHLVKDEEVVWCMDVICFGLSLPLQEHETIKDCVNVYCEWMTALHPSPRISVPKPICEDPNLYARRMINHFHNLFVPRQGETSDTINRQAVLCHRVLRTLQQTAQISQIMTRETWESLLLFLLAINEVLLAPPTVKDDVGDQLCERVLSVLFEVWLLACVRCFPSPSLWKTLQESCAIWRHRIALVEQWNRVNLALTARLLEFTYGPTFPELKIVEEDAQLIPNGMTNDCIAQTWYRFLRTIGNPTALCSPQIISKTPHFMQWSMTREDGVEAYQHPCLLALPQIFLKAIKGISSQVDAFLGIYQAPHHVHDDTNIQNVELRGASAVDIASSSSTFHNTVASSGSNFRDTFGVGGILSTATSVSSSSGGGAGIIAGLIGTNVHTQGVTSGGFASGTTGTPLTTMISGVAASDHILHSPTPPLQRRLAKSFSVAPSTSTSQQKGLSKASLIGLTSSRSTTVHPPSTPNSGPPSSSSLNSLPSIGHEQRPPLAVARPKCNSILHLFGEWLFEAAHIGGDAWVQNTKKQATEASRRPSSMIMEHRKGSISLSQPNSLTDNSNLPPGLTIDKYESGRAEAIGTLCRIFCAKKTGEEILPVYLARFYVALQQCLRIPESKECDETLASILYNSADIFRLDLDGIHVLLPGFISALELVLPEKDLKIKSDAIPFNKTELRRASINILLSILALPLHFQTLPIRDLNNGPMDRMITFIQLKPRIIHILMNALQVENDAQNTHMLLGGLLLTVQDAVAFEDNDIGGSNLQTSPPPSDTNLLSSACSERSASCSIEGGASNSSLGGQSTATLGGGAGAGRESLSHDYPSLSISDDFPADMLLQDYEVASIYDNAHALFVRATYLVCHRLISSWKVDLNVSLAALELLSGLARLHIRDSARKLTDALECKRAVKWICDYICYQCSRPPPAHSKDLHSTIVAAFQCTSAWLMQHPYLLQDKDCLTTVMEVVELGISGSKSVGKAGDAPKFKDDKELKPASMRVRDAAEHLLTIILEQVGYFPSECGPESISSLLDEVALIKHCNSTPASDNGNSISTEQAIQKFKYFVTENSTILALLEEPLGNDQDPQPTVTLLIRGPFGRHAWTMQLRHLPRSKSGTKYHAPNPGRPVPMGDTPQRIELDQKFFPDGVEKVSPCVADYSIPTFDSIREQYGNDVINRLAQMIENQTIYEKIAWAETDNSEDSLSHSQEAVPPSVCHEFQAARLFLSHFGFLSIDDKDSQNANDVPTGSRLLTVLDTKKPTFSHDLSILDKVSPRTHDTVYVFYVKAGQSGYQDIIDNMSDENVRTIDPHFWNMLQTLGWTVDVDEHSGWTGFLNTSWQLKSSPPKSNQNRSNEMKFNGENRVLYWADVGAEIAFVVPTEWNGRDENIDGSSLSLNSTHSSGDSVQSGSGNWYERSLSEQTSQTQGISAISKSSLNQKPRTLSLELEKSREPVPPRRRTTGGTKHSLLGQSSAKILLVWLESYEDHINFPIDDLLAFTRTGEEPFSGHIPRSSECHVIFLHALQSGLLRVKLQGPPGRMSFATPLVDGMVLSRRVVGNLVRQTAYNMAKRRRLDNDIYQPPHVRRRLKVQDIVQKYKMDLTYPELLAHLFKSAS